MNKAPGKWLRNKLKNRAVRKGYEREKLVDHYVRQVQTLMDEMGGRRMSKQTEILDQLYLEWSQFTEAKTSREIQLTYDRNKLRGLARTKCEQFPGTGCREAGHAPFCEWCTQVEYL